MNQLGQVETKLPYNKTHGASCALRGGLDECDCGIDDDLTTSIIALESQLTTSLSRGFARGREAAAKVADDAGDPRIDGAEVFKEFAHAIADAIRALPDEAGG